jgi:hypothetical protein
MRGGALLTVHRLTGDVQALVHVRSHLLRLGVGPEEEGEFYVAEQEVESTCDNLPSSHILVRL